MGSRDIADSLLSASDGITSCLALIDGGVDSRWLKRRLGDGSLVEPFPGVVATDPVTSFVDRLRAGLVYCGEDSWVSHNSALVLHTLVPMPRDTQKIHISVPHGYRRRSLPGLAVHQRSVFPALCRVAGFPVTGAADALADVATQVRFHDLRCWSAEAVRLEIAAIDELAYNPGRNRPTRKIMLAIAEELWAGARSGPEMAVWRGIKNRRLPLPELNARVEVDDGFRLIDGLWRRLRLGYEIDGRSVHAQAAAFDDDRVRNNEVQCRGTLLLHFSGARAFGAVDEVLAVLEVSMRRRAQELGLSWVEAMAS
jgi:hypothetical protein